MWYQTLGAGIKCAAEVILFGMKSTMFSILLSTCFDGTKLQNYRKRAFWMSLCEGLGRDNISKTMFISRRILPKQKPPVSPLVLTKRNIFPNYLTCRYVLVSTQPERKNILQWSVSVTVDEWPVLGRGLRLQLLVKLVLAGCEGMCCPTPPSCSPYESW